MPRRTLYTFPTGLVLPAATGLAEGSPFVLNHGGGLATLYTIRQGSWFEAAIAPRADFAGNIAGLATVHGDLTVTTPPPPPFTDDFNRSNRTLNGDNGWVNSTGTGMGAVAPWAIVSNKVQQSTATSDTDPILHVRNDSTPGVADVTVTTSFVAAGGFQRGFLYVCSDLGNANSIGAWWDGSAGDILVQRHVGADSNAGQWFANTQTVVSAWTGWTFPATMTIRMVYTESTKLLQIYQNGTLKNTCDMHASNFGGGAELPALSTMPYCGISGRSNDAFDNLVCA